MDRLYEGLNAKNRKMKEVRLRTHQGDQREPIQIGAPPEVDMKTQKNAIGVKNVFGYQAL